MLKILRLALPLLPLSAAQQFGRLIITILLARWMTPEHYGAFATLYVLIELLAQPASLGFGQSIVRFGSRYFTTSNQALLNGLHRFSLLAVAVAGTALTFGLIKGAVPFVDGSVTHEGLVYVLAAAPLAALVQTQAGYLLSTRRPRFSLLSKQVLPEWGAIGAGAIIVLLADSISVHEALWAIGLGLLITFLVQSTATWRDPGKEATPGYHVQEWMQASLPLMLTASGTALITRLDVIFVRVLENEQAVALFFPAVVIAGLTMIPANAINTVCKPLFAQGRGRAESEELQTVISQVVRALLLSNTVMVVFLALLGAWLLGLYGERHPVEALPLLFIMLAGRLLLPLRIVSNGLLKLVGNPWYSAIAFVSASIVAIVAALALQRDYGLEGLAWGFTIGFVFGVALRLMMVRKTLGISLAVMCGISKGKS